LYQLGRVFTPPHPAGETKTTATTATLDATLTADCRRANETPVETGPPARSSSRPCGASPACPGECTKFRAHRAFEATR
jgi:hypothetical protein